MDIQTTCTSGDIQWLPIPKNEFLVGLKPGIYFLRNKLARDQYAGLCVGKDGGHMSWSSTTHIPSSNSGDSEEECPCSIEEVQYNFLVAVISDKFKVLHNGKDYGNALLLQNINDLLLMGFDYYAHDSSCITLAREDHLKNFFLRNPCFNPFTTSSRTLPAPELEETIRLKQCFVRLRRLEHELPEEKLDQLWTSYYKSIERKTDNDAEEDQNIDVSPSPKRRSAERGRKQGKKKPLKKISVRPKYRKYSESSSDTEDDDDEEYIPVGQRRTSYRLRRFSN